jgi:FSR family fosmidomycin resistance protein-like MFS transporter
VPGRRGRTGVETISATDATGTQGAPPRRDAAVIGLVCTAHFFSHFYMLCFAPLFLFIQPDLGLTFTALGGLVSAYAVASGTCQYPMGVLVDRFGARVVLICGMGLLASSILMLGVIPVYPVMLAFAFLAGVGDSVFHPSDYTILNANVRPVVMGRAFSFHTFSGFVGWMLAPPAMTALAHLWNWQAAFIVAGAAGLVIVAVLISQPRLTSAGGKHADSHAGSRVPGFRLLTSPPILMMFVFFFVVGSVSLGVAQFMPAALAKKYGLPLVDANVTLTIFFVAGSIGVLVGGMLADRTRRLDLIAATGFAAGAVTLTFVGFVPLPFALLLAVIAFGGFMIGIISPARDLLVRAISPPGASGRVFGIVSSALNLAGAVAPLYFGFLLDAGAPTWVFLSSAVLMVFAIFSAIGAAASRRPPVVAEAPAE